MSILELSSIARGQGAECPPHCKKIAKNWEKEGKMLENWEKSGKEGEKWGKKRKNWEGSFTLPLLTEGVGYATVHTDGIYFRG